MSNELERRLERALGEAPGPDPGVTDRALRARARGAAGPGRGPVRQAPPDRAPPGRMHGGVRLGRRHARGDRGAPARREPGAGEAATAETALRSRGPSRRDVDLGGRRRSGGGGHQADADPEAARRAGGRVLGQPGLAVRRRRSRRDAARARDPRAAGRVGPPRPRRAARGGRLVTVPDPDRLPASHGERLHGRRPVGNGHASVHRRSRCGAGHARLAVGLQGARVRDGRRRRRGARRDRRVESAARPGLRHPAARRDRVRAGGQHARDRRPPRTRRARSTRRAHGLRAAWRAAAGRPSLAWLGREPAPRRRRDDAHPLRDRRGRGGGRAPSRPVGRSPASTPRRTAAASRSSWAARAARPWR